MTSESYDDHRSDAVGGVSVALAALNGILLIAGMATSLVIRQRFWGIFKDFDAELPRATVVFLTLPWIVWVAVTFVLMAALVAKEFVHPKWIPLGLNVAFLVALVGYWVFFVVAMMLPLIGLIDELS
jgi:hypothetical protein